MANKPTVTLTFAGDSSKLSKAFEEVGVAADGMKDKLKSASDDARSAGDGVADLADKADGAESKAIGFTDTLSGLQGALQGLNDPSLSFGERLAVLGQASADLAGGFANLVIPALGGMWQKLMATSAAQATLSAAQTAGTVITGALSTAMGALNAVMRANPIMTVITIVGLLVGAFILLWNKSEGFRNFFIGMWNGIKNVVGGVVNWIRGAWNGLISFFQGFVRTVGNIFSGIGNAVSNAFKGVINFVIDLINKGIGFINTLIDGINYIPGVEIGRIPKIPRLHTGGVVPGMLGSETMAILQAGERVVPRGQSGNNGATTIEFVGDVDSAFATAFQKLVRTGQIRIA